jgi:hypothetical protein
MTRFSCVIAALFLTLQAVGQINLNQGETIGVGASGVLFSRPYMYHSADFSSPVGTAVGLSTLLALCPPPTGSGPGSSGAACEIDLDTNIPITISSTATIADTGQTQAVNVIDHGAVITCTITSGSGDCVDINQYGSLVCDRSGHAGSPQSGCVIATGSGTNVVAIVANGDPSGAQSDFRFRGFAIAPSGNTTAQRGIVRMVAVEGKGGIEDVGIVGLANTIDVSLEDNLSGSNADNNNLLIKNVSAYCSGNQGCIPYSIVGGGGGTGSGYTFIGINCCDGIIGSSTTNGISTSGTAVTASTSLFMNIFAGQPITINGTQYVVATWNSPTSLTLTGSAGTHSGVSGSWGGPDGQGCFFCVDGGANGGTSVSLVEVLPLYMEGIASQPCGSPPCNGHYLAIRNLRSGDFHVQYEVGAQLTDCAIIMHTASGQTGVINIQGRDFGNKCVNEVHNSITATKVINTSSNNLDFKYTYPGDENNAGYVVDGALSAYGLISNGPKFTTSGGCGETSATITGGATAGAITTSGSASCTTTVTFSVNAINGWTCKVTDVTTGADANNPWFKSTGATTGTITSGTIVAGDVLALGPCEAY